jgi:hypothetical protein
VRSRWDVGEIDDHVGAFGQPHQQAVAMVRRDVRGFAQEAAFVPNLPDLDTRNRIEVQGSYAESAVRLEDGRQAGGWASGCGISRPGRGRLDAE